MNHVILFDDVNFGGAHKHVFVSGDLNGDFNDITSSIVVLEGTWTFFEDSDFKKPMGKPLGPGLYPDVKAVGIKNDAISSLAIIGVIEES